MKKKVISLFLSIVMICTLLPTAFAANETVTAQEAASAADRLNTLGLFKGTGTDENGNPTYDLEASSNRYAAVTMLVRLLGKEEEALSKTWDTPFTDVAAWAKPYVGYAYANGLTNGVNKEGTLFGGSQNVTATQYLTFVLRALGYDSSKDFKWNAAWELSDKIGLTDGRYNSGSGDFLRGDMAFISFCAMDVKQKDSERSLAEKLITEDVFTAEQYENLAAEEAPKEEAPKEEVPKPEVLKETTVGSVPVTFAVNGTMMPGWDWAYCGSASSYIVTPYLHGSPFNDYEVEIEDGEGSVQKNGDGTFTVSFPGTFTESFSGTGGLDITLWYDIHEVIEEDEEGNKSSYMSRTKRSFSFFAPPPEGLAIVRKGFVWMPGSCFGDNFSPYFVFDVYYDGVRIENYTAAAAEGAPFIASIQADGTLLVRKNRLGEGDFIVTYQGESFVYTLNLG